MKAIRVHEFGDPEVMRLEEVPDLTPEFGQVVVRLHAIGVNPVEAYVRSGRYAKLPPLPYTPGFDGAGVVEAVGSHVSGLRFSPGMRVYVAAGSVTGTYAEQVICQQAQVHALPQGVSFTQGASLGIPCATAWRGLFQKAKARPGERVLVHGATGGVGTAAVQLARAAGLTVVGTGGTAEGRALVAALGAHHVVDHHDADYLEQAGRLAGGDGFDVIIELLANVNLGRDLSVLAPGGRICVIGSRGTIEIDPRALMARDGTIVGMMLFSATDVERREIYAALDAALEVGTLRPPGGREIPLAEAVRAHREIMENGTRGKIVLVP
jgi:NADPH:quinone reductase